MPFGFIIAIGFAFASKATAPLNNAQSYKVAGEVGQPCHTISTTNITQCNGGNADCVINVDGETRTYFATSSCTSVLKKN